MALTNYNTKLEGLADLVKGSMKEKSISGPEMGNQLSGACGCSPYTVRFHLTGLRFGFPLGNSSVLNPAVVDYRLGRTAFILWYLKVPPDHAVIDILRGRFRSLIYPPNGNLPVHPPVSHSRQHDGFDGLVGKLRQLKPKDLETVREAVDRRLVEYQKPKA